MSEFDRIRERVRQAREARTRELLPTQPARTSALEAIVGPLAPGARVFDRVSGEEGEILGGTRENVLNPAPDGGTR
jgi:hypothetical protein